MHGIPITSLFVFWIIENEVRTLPKADKYFLTGEVNVVENVKKQIFSENRSFLFEIWTKPKNVDITVVREDNMHVYESKHDDKKEEVELMLCLSTKTNHRAEKYCLPKKLPLNVKCKHILVELQDGENILSEEIRSNLRENPQISNLFKGLKITTLQTRNPSVYINTKIDPSIRESVFFLYAMMVAFHIGATGMRLALLNLKK